MPRKSFLSNLISSNKPKLSFLRSVVSGSLYRVSDIRSNTSLSDIRTQIDTMRALAMDSQISTALSYYATDATTLNTSGQIIWATSDTNYSEVSDIINKLFDRWQVNKYARDHILELATIGNLYIPTTTMYRDPTSYNTQKSVHLDNNTIPESDFDIIPSTKVRPEDIIHIWYRGEAQGYIYQPDSKSANFTIMPECAVIHFSLGGLLGDYTIECPDSEGNVIEYDIQFSSPLMEQAVQPTQTLNLLEDALLLSSLTRVVKFVNVECGTADETEQMDILQRIKDAIEQQLSLNTATGDAQSFVNPQSPNNLIYLPRVNGQDPISITDLNMSETTQEDSKLLDHYQDKKLSVLGVPKEAMNFSANEGLGGAGSVLSQRSALYANSLQRLETGYMEGWRDAINTYFIQRGMSGYVDKFTLHMNPIITTQSTIQFEKRDAALNQATTLVDLLRNLNVLQSESYKDGLSEVLSEVFPKLGSDVTKWNIDVADSDEGGGVDAF